MKRYARMGTIKVRTVFLDQASNAKATTWVGRKAEEWSNGDLVDTHEDSEDVESDSSTLI
jgi:hypothetical protein